MAKNGLAGVGLARMSRSEVASGAIRKPADRLLVTLNRSICRQSGKPNAECKSRALQFEPNGDLYCVAQGEVVLIFAGAACPDAATGLASLHGPAAAVYPGSASWRD